MALNKFVFVLPLLFAFTAGAVLECATVHYNTPSFEAHWLCAPGAPYGGGHGQYILWGMQWGSSVDWRVVVDHVGTGSGHYADVSCYSRPYIQSMRHLISGSKSPQRGTFTWTLRATDSLQEGSWTQSGSTWDTAGCPNLQYNEFQLVDNVYQAKIYWYPNWGKRAR